MAGGNERPCSSTAAAGESVVRNGGQQRNLWTSMLESVSSGKKLPEKNILALGTGDLPREQPRRRDADTGLGGTPESQRDFLESLSGAAARRSLDRQSTPPVANHFALGYTYYDVLDADQEGERPRLLSVTWRLSLCRHPSARFALPPGRAVDRICPPRRPSAHARDGAQHGARRPPRLVPAASVATPIMELDTVSRTGHGPGQDRGTQ